MSFSHQLVASFRYLVKKPHTPFLSRRNFFNDQKTLAALDDKPIFANFSQLVKFMSETAELRRLNRNLSPSQYSRKIQTLNRPSATPYTVAVSLVKEFERFNIPYAIGGGLAYGIHCPRRTTVDVDMNIGVDLISLFQSSLPSNPRQLNWREWIRSFFAPAPAPAPAPPPPAHLSSHIMQLDPIFKVLKNLGASGPGEEKTILDMDQILQKFTEMKYITTYIQGIKVDLFPTIQKLQADAMAARQKKQMLDGDQIYVLSPEFVVLFKVMMTRGKDQDDVRHLLKYFSTTNEPFDFTVVTKYLQDIYDSNPPNEYIGSLQLWMQLRSSYDKDFKTTDLK